MKKDTGSRKWEYWKEAEAASKSQPQNKMADKNAVDKNTAENKNVENKNNSNIKNENSGNISKKSNSGANVSANIKSDAKQNLTNQMYADDFPADEKISKKKQKKLKKNGKKKHTVAIVITTLIIVLLLAGAGTYLYMGQPYQNTFIKGVTINSIDCSNLTVEQVEEQIRQQVENYEITIRFRDDQSEVIHGTDIDYKYVSDGQVEKIFEQQNWLEWVKGYWETSEYKVGQEISFDKDKLKEKMNSLDELQAANQEAPQDSIIVYTENKEFDVSQEVQGNTIDADKLYQGLEEAVAISAAEISAEDLDVYEKPAVTSDDEKLNQDKDILNTYAKASITYTLPGGETATLDGITLITWMTADENGNYKKDDAIFADKIKTYVTQMAEKYNTLGQSTTFVGANNRTITVSGGNYGYKIDTAGEIAQLTADINSLGVVEREPVYSSKAKTTENGGIGDTFVEVDLTGQHVYYHENGEIVWESDCVSGKASVADRKTPAGVYTLYGKQKDRTLKGTPLADGTPSYESFVKYWMPFNKGIGLHDASWRSSFGGTIYKSSGSHGCINLPSAKAATLYDMLEVGTVVVCYY